MMIRSVLLLAFFLSAGCISTMEEPGPMKFPEEPVRRERQAPELVPPSEDVTPTERWKSQLEAIAPKGWQVGEAVDQLEAPEGWWRIEGGRGIAYTITCKDKKFTVWFLPKDWKGREDGTAPVKLFGANQDWQMFATTTGHEGWEKAEEDTARVFGVSPARG